MPQIHKQCQCGRECCLDSCGLRRSGGLQSRQSTPLHDKARQGSSPGDVMMRQMRAMCSSANWNSTRFMGFLLTALWSDRYSFTTCATIQQGGVDGWICSMRGRRVQVEDAGYIHPLAQSAITIPQVPQQDPRLISLQCTSRSHASTTPQQQARPLARPESKHARELHAAAPTCISLL
jgi:hypothetical protein